MTKVLLIEDSLTIQKVIKLTFANKPFEVHECMIEDDISSSIEDKKPDLILLDFNISDSKTGYEISEEMKKKYPQTKIIILFGSFDTIDESLLLSCGASDKVVKPFVGSEFVDLCTNVMSSNDTMDLVGSEIEAVDDNTFWEVNSPSIEQSISFDNENETPNLQASLDEWSVEVPSVIGSESEISSLPPIIEETASFDSIPDVITPVDTPSSDISVPSEADLEYPDLTSNDDHSATSQLVPMSDLNDLENAVDVDDEATQEFSFEPVDESLISKGAEEEVNLLRKEISEEVKSDIWAADEFYDATDFQTDEPTEVVESKIEEPQTIENEIVEDVFIQAKEESSQGLQIDEETLERIIEEKVNERMEEIVKQYVKKYCEESIDKVAWEMMPDLAENLIKEELSKITDDVLEK